MMESQINPEVLRLMTDSGSPVSSLVMMNSKRFYITMFVPPLHQDEKYVNEETVNYLVYIFCEVGGNYIQTARVVVAGPGRKSIFGQN